MQNSKLRLLKQTIFTSFIFAFLISNCFAKHAFSTRINGLNYLNVNSHSKHNVVLNYKTKTSKPLYNLSKYDVDQLQVSLNRLIFEPTASGKSISITSNVNWSVSGIPSWLNLSVTAGSGNQTITFTTQVNSTSVTRNATIIITGNALTQTINVSQYGVASLIVALNLADVQKDISNKPLGMNMNYLMKEFL